MSKLTYAQKQVLDDLASGKVIYVFRMKGVDKFSYGYQKDETACRLYLTLTCRSLVRRLLVRHNLDVDKEPWDDYIGVLELVKEK